MKALPLLAFIPFVLAARILKPAASRPRSSINDASGLQAIRSRQASSRDLVRRLKEGKRRKRADPSDLPCTQASGFETITNGGFEDGGPGQYAPWTRTVSSGPGLAYGYTTNAGSCASSVASGCQAFIAGTALNGPGLITLTQTVDVCSSGSYQFTFEFGTDMRGQLCTVASSIGSETQFVFSDPCGGMNPACSVPGNGFAYQFYTRVVSFASSGQTDVTFFFDCSSVVAVDPTNDYSKTYVVDKVSLVRV